VNLDEFESARSNASVAASTQARTLAVAGLALVWLFAGDFFLRRTNSKPSVLLAIAGVCLVLCLLADVTQLFVRWALLERGFTRAEARAAARHPADTPEFEDVGSAVKSATVPIFVSKFVLLAAGYVVLAVYFASRFAR
jgi:formate hydrogenlyase subunit 3/multisubunit Na+/H+ antiporter MnhD subunit